MGDKEKEIFCRLLNHTIYACGLDSSDFTKQFGISMDTFKRWREGVTAPHRAMYSSVYEFLIENLLSEIDRFNDTVNDTIAY